MTAITQNGGTLPSRIHENDTTSAGWLPIPGANSPADTPEFAYQTRYFSIHLDSENRMTSVNVKNIVAFSEEDSAPVSICDRLHAEEQGALQFHEDGIS